MDHSDSPTKVEANELTTPFPALEYLKLYPGRIFDDYALFQRCSNTLINLDIELDRKTVDILEKTNVFSGAKNSQLCHITLRIAFDSRITMSAVEFVKFAVGLSTPATRTLAINGDIPYQSIIRVIPTCPYAEKLQILDLREVNLSLSEMISIIKLVPIVADFSRTFRGIDPELNSQQGTSLPGYLYPYIYPLGHWLKCWYIYPTVAVSTRDIAISAITLTTLCPRFTCALLQGGDFGGIYRELCSGIDSGLYGEYAETIKKLFYIGV